MIQRRARSAGIKTRIGNHTFRATGITAYMKNAASSKPRSRLPITSHRGRQSFTTGRKMRFRAMKSSGL